MIKCKERYLGPIRKTKKYEVAVINFAAKQNFLEYTSAVELELKLMNSRFVYFKSAVDCVFIILSVGTYSMFVIKILSLHALDVGHNQIWAFVLILLGVFFNFPFSFFIRDEEIIFIIESATYVSPFFLTFL